MPTCVFFGHRDCPEDMTESLFKNIEKLIEQGVDRFYMGNQGQFDTCARRVMKQIVEKHPVDYSVALAYLPGEKTEYTDFSDTLFPEGIELGPPQFAIDRRNRWLVEQADYCICYINHTWGGAYKYVKQLKNRGIPVINLAVDTFLP